jgi:hypothetical protein
MSTFKIKSNDPIDSILANFEIGKNIIDSQNTNLGVCINNLTDLDQGWDNKTLSDIEKSGAIERAQSKLQEMDTFDVYGYRKVFTKEFGTTEQLLVKESITKSLVWANYDINQYTFKPAKIKQKKKTPKP